MVLATDIQVAQNIGFGLSRWWGRPSAADARRVDELLEAFGTRS